MSTDYNNPYEPPKTFERFSADIRKAMELANLEAKHRFAQSIDTIHLMTAIAQESSGLGGVLLRQYGISATLVRKQSRHLRSGAEWVTFFGKIPLSPNTKRVIDSAINFAMVENHDCVGTGGVLLAILNGDEQSTDVLCGLGINLELFESNLRRYLHRLMVEAPGEELLLDPVDSID